MRVSGHVHGDQRGAATVTALAMVAVLGAVAVVLAVGAGLFVEHRRAQAAADLAALAGAGAVAEGDPCAAAAATAGRNGAELTSCEVLDRDVRVVVAVRRDYPGGWEAVVEGVARAGPAGPARPPGAGGGA
ncbi:secretion/DNA translocation related TadE-like protein [Nocardioides zeae]|uniref:Secretion/DNA translocation related TadE-like protein n=2 Tax=Nocardioides zeae TaxID=1457234 RepID=A0ACC6IMW1_9ACTN|nr:secretion/DNA translocation related TadE-like protein [Nocardioides zeae]MDR6174771.1 secretion/DNA translocation related TadE-like protein [Nocardioides zeae]MDR6212039.1 secretion/DNA translocation related TadE-like protein [Nocardioides zeae]